MSCVCSDLSCGDALHLQTRLIFSCGLVVLFLGLLEEIKDHSRFAWYCSLVAAKLV